MKKENFVRKLTRTGKYSFALLIPTELVKKFGWREKQKLSLEVKPRNRIEIRDWKKR